MLAISVWLSALEYDITALMDGKCGRIVDTSIPFSMYREKYIEVSEVVKHFAATIEGRAAANAAHIFLRDGFWYSRKRSAS